MQLSELSKQVIAFRNERKWEKWHGPKDSAIYLTLEVAELIKHLQWKTTKQMKIYLQNAAHKNAVSEELADVLYWVLTLSSDFSIDLESAFLAKMKKNAKKYPVKK